MKSLLDLEIWKGPRTVEAVDKGSSTRHTPKSSAWLLSKEEPVGVGQELGRMWASAQVVKENRIERGPGDTRHNPLAALVTTTVHVLSLQTTVWSAEDFSKWHKYTREPYMISDSSFTHCSTWNTKQASLIILITSYFTHFTNYHYSTD